jgi:hypothetical protein
VTDIASTNEGWKVTLNNWEPSHYVEATTKCTDKHLLVAFAATVVLCISGLAFARKADNWHIMAGMLAAILPSLVVVLGKGNRAQMR